MKNLILILIISFIFTSCASNTTETNKIINDTSDQRVGQPFISLVGIDCIKKGDYQIFQIKNVTGTENFIVEPHGASGSIVTPKNPIGNGEFRIKILDENTAEFVTIKVTDYGEQRNAANAKVIITQKIKICN